MNSDAQPPEPMPAAPDEALEAAIETIRQRDPRYAPDAYAFVRQALDFTGKLLDKPPSGPNRHISGTELLEGIRQFALREFGPMALTVLNTWGVRTTADFGEIVFNMVAARILGKTEEDSKDHFADGYDFGEAFAKPFQPSRTPRKPKRGGRAHRGHARGRESVIAASHRPESEPPVRHCTKEDSRHA